MDILSFASDNHTGVHEKIMEAIVAANKNTSPSYEMDELSRELKSFLKNEWGCREAFLVFNGTAANVLALQSCMKSFESVICTDISHLNTDECAAPEKWLGCKVVSVPHQNGKLVLSTLESYMVRKGDQHFSQPKVISITQPTEYGTVYSLEEIHALRDFCRQHEMYLHIDGARLANAAFHLQVELRSLVKLADVVSLGGTKNGLLFGEMVLINHPKLGENFKFYRKQALQLPSKTRFMAAQFLTYLQNELWLQIARHQCELAQFLAGGLRDLGKSPLYPVQSNAVFSRFTKGEIKELRKEFFFYVWDENTLECRLMCSFDSRKEDLQRFLQKLKNLKGEVAWRSPTPPSTTPSI